MSISALFVRRPVMTTLVMSAILIFGIAGYRQLPVSDLPNVDFPTINVNAILPGASPETMASSVATPLEKQFSTIAGISSMTSTSLPPRWMTLLSASWKTANPRSAARRDCAGRVVPGASRGCPRHSRRWWCRLCSKVPWPGDTRRSSGRCRESRR